MTARPQPATGPLSAMAAQSGSSGSTSQLPKSVSADPLSSLHHQSSSSTTLPSSTSMSSLSSFTTTPGSSSVGGTGYQPLCFSKEVFNRPSFNVDEFIADCRRRVPLESVLKDLEEYSVSLQNELIVLINQDYTDFVSLSTNLVGLDGVIHNLRLPLASMKQRLAGVRGVLDNHVAQLDAKLQEKQQVESRKEVLELFVNVHESISKIERLLHIGGKDGAGGRPDSIGNVLMKADEETSKLIQRVANEFNQLKFYVSKGSDYPFIQKMEKRISFIENSLQRGMEHLYKQGLNTKNADIIANCLRTYAAIDRIREAETLYRVHSVRPVLEKIITVARLEGGKRGSSEGLQSMYNDIIGWIDTDCKLILDITHSAVHDFDFLSNAIWAEAAELIEKNVPRIFLPGIPDNFYTNYNITMHFVERVEQFCRTRAQLEAFRAHASFKQFMKKWNLPVYFQLRFQEIAVRFEANLTTSTSQAVLDMSQEYLLKPTRALSVALNECWAKGLYLPALLHRFYKLSLQLLARYVAWAQQIRKDAAKLAAQQSAAAVHDTSLNPAALPSPVSSTTTGPAPTAAAQPEPLVQSLLQPEELVYLYYDIEKLKAALNAQYFPKVRELNAHLPAEVQSILQAGYDDGVAELVKELPEITSVITDLIIKRCASSLLPLRGITRTYRLTNKPVPTRHSYYVPNVLKPLQTFLDEKKNHISAETRRIWIEAVLAAVSKNYHEMSTELLETVHKTESFFKKYSPAKAAQPEPGEMTDTDKIVRQLLLDVEEFGRQLSPFTNVIGEPRSFAPFAQLLQYVSSADRYIAREGAASEGEGVTTTILVAKQT